MKGRVFSGTRPTGRQHLGNYLGAIQNYVALQADYECIYCVVDLHALTTLEDTQKLRDNTHEMVLDWLAAGIDPEKTITFVQSHAPAVTELHTILSMVTPMSWLTRVSTFKEKVRTQPHNVNYGLLGYPVLMAADILLYRADTVPVGEDQLPHLELSREIARRFNSTFGLVFPEPQAKLSLFPRILGIDGVQKMSKSLDNHIELAVPPAETKERVMQMFTDPQRTHRHIPGRPEVCNVFSLHKFYSPDEVKQVERDCRAATLGCVDCKERLAENLIRALQPFRERRAALAADPKLVANVLAEGALRARILASQTMAEVREKVGLP